MAPEPLARIACDPAELATMIEYAALRSGDSTAHEEMFVRVHGDRIETPAAAPDADLKAYCTGRAAMFDELALFVDQPVDALFDIDRSLGWLAWHDAETVAITFEGDPATGVTERLVHETDGAEVVLPCETGWTREEVSLSLPAQFRDDRLLDVDGEPVPTVVRTTAGELERLVGASEVAGTGGTYDVVVADGELRLDVAGPGGEAAGTLEGSVTGPDVRTTVGEAFEPVVSALVGPVALQTGPAAPLAVVRDHEAFTLRFVVERG